ncbi:hypothetical protein [Nitrosovibrio sp. Nv4]|uniref:hypothetical protein n=1 Tax=Nitrosovibrio sp. Nv4 TaxID=1945880 RepID=UPI000BE2909F|nr:hypothetical protein [Nitrosovibrio sp. Nv4]
MAKVLDVSERNLHARRRRIENKRKIKLGSDKPQSPDMKITMPADSVRVQVEMENGVIIVGSDKHYWPGLVSTAHRAAVSAIKGMKPNMYITNGDAFDGPTAGRHGRIMWEARPSVKQELEAVQDRLAEIEKAMGNGALHWNWGNHDQRFNTKLSAMVPEFEGVPGFNLKDHFPRWKFGMSLMVNGHTMVKHRWHNGIHAAYNNVLKSGTSVVTGHLHALQVRPYTDYNGTRYAVDTGTLAHPFGPQFTYAEDSPANHRSGFAVLTFHKGKLMPPELLEVIDEEAGLVFFRGVAFTV